MSESVFRRESAVEFFKELVDGALAHQRLAANELTAFYVVQLLASFVDRGGAHNQPDAPLAVRLAHALEDGGARQRSSHASLSALAFVCSWYWRKNASSRL